MKKMMHGLLAVVAILVLMVPLTGCSNKASIVGRWDFEPWCENWDYGWMEFFEDGTYVDDWGNYRTWMMASDSQVKLTAMDGYSMLFAVKVQGDTITITSEDGSAARGTRDKY